MKSKGGQQQLGGCAVAKTQVTFRLRPPDKGWVAPAPAPAPATPARGGRGGAAAGGSAAAAAAAAQAQPPAPTHGQQREVLQRLRQEQAMDPVVVDASAEVQHVQERFR
eukprot:COSAG01_NODE_697_length_14188_cov_41.810348_13_plen_109_part_00